jgi:hypothetical protein
VREHWRVPLEVGYRVRHERTGETGVIHALYPDDFEDDVEVRLDNGGYSCWWGKHVTLIARYPVLREAAS